jgi:omega-amidase
VENKRGFMFKIALCQTKVYKDKAKNLENAMEKIRKAANVGAKVISLPEMFTCPYSAANFRAYSEKITESKTLEALQELCLEKKIYLIAGSIPELQNDNIYNTSFIINTKGEIINKYRKTHLFDVNIKNSIRFSESAAISRGSNVIVFETEYCKIGICICYDIRFPELIRNIALRGAKLIFVPAAFSKTTGPAHWELLFRARAVDNQLYMAGISPARECEGTYKPYGNSIIVNPWGEVISRAGEEDEIIYADIDLVYLDKVRKELPVLEHRRPELY